MDLQPGSVLGHYRLAGKLGVGGMGEVWRGIDTSLSREVAIKVLPPAFASDPERLARFEREAKVLASLNHPNVATVHGFHEAGGVRFLAMELVPGEDLAERLKQGRLPVAEALEVARQTAEALEAAHELGIVHRDLKPANVKRTAEGRVKVLDFGLAKAAETADAGRDSGFSPTITSLGTVAGVILGTAAYMSPEQARGKPVDKRADIWAFGCLLFEMLSGARPFDGETVSDTLAAVLAKEPNWSAVPSATPARVRELIARCLEKDPKRRLRDIGDARIELESALAARTASGQLRAVPESAALPAAAPRRGAVVIVPLAIAAVASIALAAWSWTRPVPTAVPGRLARLRDERPPGESVTGPGSFALAPDGSAVVFAITGGTSTPRLWIREIDDPEGREIPGTENATFPFWSPDSRHIAFFSDGRLARVPRSGGAVQTVCRAANARGGAWGAGGTIVFAPNPFSPLAKVAADGGNPEPATTLDEARKQDSHRFPSFLPDGRRFTYLAQPGPQPRLAQIEVASLDDPVGRPLLLSGCAARYAAPGYLLFSRDQALVAQKLDLGTLEMSGDIIPLVDRADVFPRITGTWAVDADAQGTLVYDEADRRGTSGRWISRDGRPSGTEFRVAGPMFAAELSRQGDRVAALEVDGADIAIVVVDIASGTTSRAVRSDRQPRGFTWTPDGRLIVHVREQGMERIVSVDPNGGSERNVLQLGGRFTVPDSVAPDGTIVFSDLISGRRNDMVVLPRGEGAATQDYLATDAEESGARISPDGRFIAYTSDASGRQELYVDSFPSPREARRVSTDGTGGPAAWRADGRELYWPSADGRALMACEVTTSPALSFRPPRAVFAIPERVRDVVASSDGQRLLVLEPIGERRSSLTFVQNWSAQLEIAAAK